MYLRVIGSVGKFYGLNYTPPNAYGKTLTLIASECDYVSDISKMSE